MAQHAQYCQREIECLSWNEMSRCPKTSSSNRDLVGVMFPVSALRLDLGLRWQGGRSGQMDLQQEQQGVGWKVQIEVHEAVQQESGKSHNRSSVQSPRKVSLFSFEILARLPVQQGQESDAAEPSRQA